MVCGMWQMLFTLVIVCDMWPMLFTLVFVCDTCVSGRETTALRYRFITCERELLFG